MSFLFPGSSKDRAPVQNLIRYLDPKILENQEIFPNGQLKSSDIFKNLTKTTKEYLVNFQVNKKKKSRLTNKSIEVMLKAIDYYTSKGCITELKSPKGITQQLLLSKNLYDYLNEIRDILPTQSSGPPQSSTPQQPYQQGIQIGPFVSKNGDRSSTSKNGGVSSTTNESTKKLKTPPSSSVSTIKMFPLGGFLSSSKDRLKTTAQNKIRDLNPEILKNEEIFPNGQLIPSSNFKDKVRDIRTDYIHLTNYIGGRHLTNEELKVIRQVIKYYTKENCMRIINRKGLQVSLSRDLLVYLNKIKIYLNKIKIYLNQIKKKLQSVQQEQINMQEDNTPQQINHPTQISPPLGALSTYNPIIPTQKSPPLGALSTYNPIIPTTLPPQSTVPKTNTRQQLGSSRIPEFGPVPKKSGIIEFNNPIYKTQRIRQQFRENTSNP